MVYLGSKKRIQKDIAPIINKLIKDNDIKKYVEPFVGGANMIEAIECDTRIGNDANKYLIAMWQRLQAGWVPMTLEEMVKSRLNPGETMDLFDKEQANRFYNELKADYLANVKGKDIFDIFNNGGE
jgi:site-specific DNA-adenine methylase